MAQSQNTCLFQEEEEEVTVKMDLRDIGMDPAVLVDALHEILDLSDEIPDKPTHHAPSRAYIRDKKAMAATPADVLEYPDSYLFVLDMPGLKQDQIKVNVEDGNLLVVSGERRRQKAEKEHVKYVRMERRMGKYFKKFALGENADTENITAHYGDGVLTVTVGKRPPPEPKKPKTVEVQIG